MVGNDYIIILIKQCWLVHSVCFVTLLLLQWSIPTSFLNLLNYRINLHRTPDGYFLQMILTQIQCVFNPRHLFPCAHLSRIDLQMLMLVFTSLMAWLERPLCLWTSLITKTLKVHHVGRCQQTQQKHCRRFAVCSCVQWKINCWLHIKRHTYVTGPAKSTIWAHNNYWLFSKFAVPYLTNHLCKHNKCLPLMQGILIKVTEMLYMRTTFTTKDINRNVT